MRAAMPKKRKTALARDSSLKLERALPSVCRRAQVRKPALGCRGLPR